ncbi:MAG: hypothetical protein AAGD32_08700 [Planctomycetota bacterium]
MRKHILPAALLASTLPLTTLAQEGGFGGEFGGRQNVQKPVYDAPDDAKYFDEINLYNAGVGQVIDYFRDSDPTFQAIIMTPEHADAVLPPLQLKNMRAHDVLALLNGERFDNFVMEVVHEQVGGRLIYKIHVHPAHGRVTPQTEQEVRTFALGSPIEDGDDILGLLDQLAATLPGDTPPTLQIHRETGIVIAKGYVPQLKAIESLFDRLQETKDWDGWRQEFFVLQEKAEQATRQVAGLTAQLEAQRLENELLRRQLAQTEQRLAQTQERNDEQSAVIIRLQRTVDALEQANASDAEYAD